MNNTGLISIIMPAFNVEKYIERAVSSILDQTYENFELLIADDCSTDSTLNIINSFEDSRIRVLPNPEKLGYTKSCNRLFPLCQGEYITFQDADDFSSPDRLEIQLNHLYQRQNLAMCGTGVTIITDRERKLDEIHRSRTYMEILKNLPQHNQFIGSTIMIRHAILKKVGGYREEFSRWGNQDYDWAYRICEGHEAENIPKALYFYRQNIHSNSKKVSELRAIGPSLVQEFGKQRKEKGMDLLMKGDRDGVARLEEQLLGPYRLDKSLIYHVHAKNRIYIHQYQEAWRLIIKSIRSEPFVLRNYVLLPSLLLRVFYRLFKYRGDL